MKEKTNQPEKYQQSYYHKRAEEIKKRRKERYQEQREKELATRKKRYSQTKTKKAKMQKIKLNKYYDASCIRVLMNLKTYTELNKDKHKLWADFCWTFKDLHEAGFNDIVPIMKLREQADQLIKDYWATARGETEEKGKNWNDLTETQQQRLIAAWGQEKAAEEKALKEGLKEIETRGQELEQEIELAKFHEERGKVKCACWNCQGVKEMQEEIKREQKEAEKEQRKEWEWVHCAGCEKKKRVDRINEEGLCGNCVGNF